MDGIDMLPDMPDVLDIAGLEDMGDFGGLMSGLGGEEVLGDYVVRSINRSTWVTPQYYTDLVPIGSGAFGAVW